MWLLEYFRLKTLYNVHFTNYCNVLNCRLCSKPAIWNMRGELLDLLIFAHIRASFYERVQTYRQIRVN